MTNEDADDERVAASGVPLEVSRDTDGNVTSVRHRDCDVAQIERARRLAKRTIRDRKAPPGDELIGMFLETEQRGAVNRAVVHATSGAREERREQDRKRTARARAVLDNQTQPKREEFRKRVTNLIRREGLSDREIAERVGTTNRKRIRFVRESLGFTPNDVKLIRAQL